MAKRFTTIFFIVLGIVAFLCVGFFLVLILAPGTRIFGLMYVAKDARAYNSTRLNLITELNKQGFDGFSGSITVETDEVPVYIEYTERYGYEFQYYENYVGLTKSTLEKPFFELSKDKHGGVVIKVHGFKKFLFENKVTTRFLKIFVPLVEVSGYEGGDTNLTIKSDKSNVTFLKQESDDLRIPSFNQISIETKGKIILNGTTEAKTYKLVTPNTITIDENYKNVVKATHYDLESTRGRILIKTPVLGDVKAKTNNGSIKLVSCRNLTVNTNYGDIIGSDEDGKIDVQGMAYITVKSGKVSLGKVLGGAESMITTSSGRVVVDKIGEVTITTRRGSVTVNSIKKGHITTNTGNITVEEALEALEVDTVRGKVTLGAEGMTMNNINVDSHIGRVYVNSAQGTAVVTTTGSDVYFTNTTSENVTITAGGNVEATGLKGSVTVTAEKDAKLTFTSITERVSVTAGSKTKSIVVYALSNTTNDIGFVLKGKNVIHYEANDSGTGSYSNMGEGSHMTNRTDGTLPIINVEGKNAVVKIYLKASVAQD